MKYKKKIKNNKSAGFTLIEMVLVIGLTAMVFSSVYALFSNTIKQDTESRFELVAANLAQEGVEIIRNIRDENVMRAVDTLGSENQTTGIDDGLLGNGGICYPHIDTDSKKTGCDGTKEEIIVEEDPSGVERYANCKGDSCNNSTRFTRRCEITNETENQSDKEFVDKLKVTCIVGWESFTGAGVDGKREISASAILTNWQE